MPRQRIHHSRVTYQVPHDFPERLERFKEESGLSWAEIARRLDVHHETLRRWRKGLARPSMRNMMALVALARPLGLAHLLTAWTLPDEARRENPRQRRPDRVRESWEESRAEGRRPTPQGPETQRGQCTPNPPPKLATECGWVRYG